MHISALLVFVSAVMSVYGYHGLPCSDCNQQCREDCLNNITDQLHKHMAFSDCRVNKHISDTANPTWKCTLTTDVNRFLPVYNATCDKCHGPSSFKEVSILQRINMLFRESCPSTYKHRFFKLTVKPVTISLGCTCAL